MIYIYNILNFKTQILVYSFIIIIFFCYVRVTQEEIEKNPTLRKAERKLRKPKLSSKEKEKVIPNNQSNLNHKFLQFLLTQLKPLIIYILRFIIFRTGDFFFFFFFFTLAKGKIIINN